MKNLNYSENTTLFNRQMGKNNSKQLMLFKLSYIGNIILNPVF